MMSIEFAKQSERKPRRTALGLAALALTAACSSPHAANESVSESISSTTTMPTATKTTTHAMPSTSAPTTEPETSRPPQPVSLIPDLSGFLQNPTTCLNGGPRPCAIVVRAKPELDSSFLNTAPEGDEHVDWPREKYGTFPGDKVKVLCYVPNGNAVRDYIGHAASNDWYKIEVPGEHVYGPSELTVAGFASIEWFNEREPDLRVDECAP